MDANSAIVDKKDPGNEADVVISLNKCPSLFAIVLAQVMNQLITPANNFVTAFFPTKLPYSFTVIGILTSSPWRNSLSFLKPVL